ncbi:MAG: SGNH/GDSL hydrolase family protein [Candidatus Krumholzibacteriota bacterium]|nr:SGNH/GDSL hydrolase family protein [Candidatus Krumholzibacteriota bacterium]
MKKAIKNLIVVTLPTLLAGFLLLEILFRTLIPAAQVPQNRFDEKELMFIYRSGQRDGIYTSGRFAQQRARWHINNYGWNSAIDYREVKTRPRIAVIGDSFVDAHQVDPGKKYPALLREALRDSADVYSFGKCGAPLSQYLHISRYVDRLFDPDVFIFNVVMNDFDESIRDLNPFIHWLTLEIDGERVTEVPPRADYSQSQYNWKKRLLKRSAVFRYLYSNLRVEVTLRRLGGRGAETCADNTRRDRMRRNIGRISLAADYILARIGKELAGKRTIIVIDAPRTEIYSGKGEGYDLEVLHRLMADLCAKHGLELLDMTGPMKDDYFSRGIKYNSPYDNHWNEYGHQFVGRELLRALRKGSGKGPDLDPGR